MLELCFVFVCGRRLGVCLIVLGANDEGDFETFPVS